MTDAAADPIASPRFGRLRNLLVRARIGRAMLPRATGYDAFVSYSHGADSATARALQAGLHRFARRPFQLRALRVFRDQTNLATAPGLWTSIASALDASRYLLLLASPGSAGSPWVAREVEYWRERKSRDTLILCVTAGEVAWDVAARDFDLTASTALSEALRGYFDQEPLWVDLRELPHDALTLANPKFGDAVAAVAATLHARPKDELVGEDVRQRRRTRRLAAGAVSTLVLLTVATTITAVLALKARDQARRQTRLAVSRQLVTEALQPSVAIDTSLLLAVEAVRVARTPETVRSLLSRLQRDPHLTALVDSGAVVALSRDGRSLVTGDGPLVLRDGTTGDPLGPPFAVRNAAGAAFGDGGRTLTVLSHRSLGPDEETAVVQRFDVASRRLIADEPLPSPRWVPRTLAADGTAVALFDPGTKRVAVFVVGPGHRTRLIPGPVLRGALVGTLIGGSGGPEETPALAVTSGGSQVVIESQGRSANADTTTVRVWDVRRNTLRTVRRGWPTGPRLSSLGRLAFVEAQRIVLYDVRTGKAGAIRLPPELRSNVSLSGFSRDGRWLLATRGVGTTQWVFDVLSRRLLFTLTSPLLQYQWQVDAASQTGTLFSGGALWSVRRRRLVTRLAASYPDGVAFGGEGDRLVAADRFDSMIRSWRLPALTPLGVVRYPKRLFSPHVLLDERGDVIVFPSYWTYKRTAVWSVTKRRLLRSAPSTSYDAGDVAVSHDGSRLVLVDSGGRLVLWDTRLGRPLVRIRISRYDRARENWPSVGLSSDGRKFAFVGTHGAMLVNGTRRIALGRLPGWAGIAAWHASDIAFSEDGALLAIKLGDKIGLWRTRDGRRLPRDLEEAPASQDSGIAFSHDGRLVAAAAGSTVALWDVASGQLLGTLTPTGASEARYARVAFSPDDHRLAATGEDSGVKVWDVALDDWIELACRTAARNLTRNEWARYRGGAPYRATCHGQ